MNYDILPSEGQLSYDVLYVLLVNSKGAQPKEIHSAILSNLYQKMPILRGSAGARLSKARNTWSGQQ